jgi:hypothetical protein
MKTHIIIFLSTILSLKSTGLCAQDSTFIREYTYRASDYDSKVTARSNALQEVQKLLLEEVAVFVHSEVTLTKSSLETDGDVSAEQNIEATISTLTAGVTKTEIIAESWNGEEYWLKAAMQVNPEQVRNDIEAVMANAEQMAEIDSLRAAKEAAEAEITRLKEALAEEQTAAEREALTAAYTEQTTRLETTDLLNRARLARNNEQLDEARSLLIEAAKRGDPRAQFFIGEHLARGKGVERDDKKAFYWLSKAARGGHVKAIFYVGVAFFQGRGVESDKPRGAELVAKAMDKGLPEAKIFWQRNEMWRYLEKQERPRKGPMRRQKEGRW